MFHICYDDRTAHRRFSPAMLAIMTAPIDKRHDMKLLAAAALGAALLAPAASAAPQRHDPQAWLERLLAGRTPGALVDCLDPRIITGTEIVSGEGIAYRIGRRLYLNRPRIGREDLRRDDIMVSRRPTTRLCRGEPIQLIDRAGRFQRGFVTLGNFVPYTLRG